MKNSNLKAFTLVEMLIVIVIIGILIAALLPRMSAAQGRARDVARKTALSQIQSAIVTYQGDKWKWPQCDSSDNCDAKDGLDISEIKDELLAGWLNSIPSDPLATTKVKWLWDDGSDGQFRYMVTKRNWTDNAGFVLMAKTEVEWWSNWVVCDDYEDDSSDWEITSDTDIVKDILICSSVSKNTDKDAKCKLPDPNWENTDNTQCVYTDDTQLRYIITY